MAMRLTGLMSGMDTESIVQELVAAKQTKVDDLKKEQTKHQWTQDAWSELNKKLKSLQSKYLNNMRFADAYTKKVTNVSNSSAVSVITGEGVADGVQELKINKVAKTAYLTGGKLEGENGSLTALSKLSDIKDAEIQNGSITIKAGSKTVDLDITADTTISDVLDKLKEAGLNANFDANNQRFFIGAKESGKVNDFSITSNDLNGEKALSALGLVPGDETTDPTGEKMARKIDGQDAEILLNGAKFTSSNNVFEINGLTITALSETNGETVTLTTQNDTDGIYDMIKGFLKEYNSIINEIDKLYNADSSKGYDPLTSEEKEAMSESEIEEWEQKIKDSLLRRDSNLSTIRNAFITEMASDVTVNGKKMYLHDFGIETLGYFLAADNEKNAYHIDGDPDDEDTMNEADKLKSMIASDPDTVISFFTQLSRNMYSKMSELSASVDGYRTFGSFYDDKKMKSDYDDYTTKIKEAEQKLADYEDKWYSKFSAMETAMAKMQSNANAVTSLLGG